MDYESIAQGRRRNWDPLKPDDVRAREKEEKLAAKKAELEAREKAGKRQIGYLEKRERLKVEEGAADDAEWLEARRQVRKIIIIAASFVLGVIVVGMGINFLRDKRQATLLEEYQVQIANGMRVNDFTTPVGALSTWRSAWLAGDMETVIALNSPKLMEKSQNHRPMSEILNDYRRIYRSKGFEGNIEIASGMTNPEIVHIPGRPWRNEQVAIFRSQPLMTRGDTGSGRRFIVAFSFHESSGTWRYADAREAKYYSVKWISEAMIGQLRAGPRAPTYDDDGDLLDRPRDPNAPLD